LRDTWRHNFIGTWGRRKNVILIMKCKTICGWWAWSKCGDIDIELIVFDEHSMTNVSTIECVLRHALHNLVDEHDGNTLLQCKKGWSRNIAPPTTYNIRFGFALTTSVMAWVVANINMFKVGLYYSACGQWR
jgi:hypothetical protein